MDQTDKDICSSLDFTNFRAAVDGSKVHRVLELEFRLRLVIVFFLVIIIRHCGRRLSQDRLPGLCQEFLVEFLQKRIIGVGIVFQRQRPRQRWVIFEIDDGIRVRESGIFRHDGFPRLFGR